MAAVLQEATGVSGGEGVVIYVVVISISLDLTTVLTVVVPGPAASSAEVAFAIGAAFSIGAALSTGVMFSIGPGFGAVVSAFTDEATFDETVSLRGVQKTSSISSSVGLSCGAVGEGVISIGSSRFLYARGVIILAASSGVNNDGEIQILGVLGVEGVGGDPPIWFSGVVARGEAISVSSFRVEKRDIDFRGLG